MNNKSTLRLTTVALASLITASLAQAAAAPDPGDYTGLPAGTDLALVYAQRLRADEVYSKGQKVVNNLGLGINVGLFRYVHFTKLGDYIIDPQIIVPFGSQRVDLLNSKTSGIGDILVGGTLWTVADLKNSEHLGFTAFVTLPTGNDKNQGYALSNNRYALDLQAGWIHKLSDNWTMDLIGQTEFYGKQRDTDLKKDPLLRAYAHFRYGLTPGSHVAVSLRQSWGAKESINGVTQTTRQNDTNIGFTYANFVTKQVQLQFQYFRDTKVENGPKVSQLNARVLYLY